MRPIQSHKRTHSGVVLAASGFEAGVPVLSFIPSEVFFILFYPCGKTEFMTCHLFLLTAQAIRCLGKRFSRLFSGASQNTWWHKWHEKYAIQFVSGYYFTAWTVIVMCWLQADFYFSSCRADCHFRQLGKAKVFISSLWQSIKCLIKYHLMVRLTFLWGVSLCGWRNKKVRNEVGEWGVTSMEDKEAEGEVFFRLAADWRICVIVRGNTVCFDLISTGVFGLGV